MRFLSVVCWLVGVGLVGGSGLCAINVPELGFISLVVMMVGGAYCYGGYRLWQGKSCYWEKAIAILALLLIGLPMLGIV